VTYLVSYTLRGTPCNIRAYPRGDGRGSGDERASVVAIQQRLAGSDPKARQVSDRVRWPLEVV
jgi:hypothetical protein